MMKITQNTPYQYIYISINISGRFFKTNLTKCAVIWVKKRQKGRFRKPEKLQNHSNEGKRKEKKKERGEGKEKRKKQWLHSEFSNGYFGYFRPKKLLDAKGQFGDNVIKNPARNIYMYMYTGKVWETKIDGARNVIPAVMQRKQYIYMINSSTWYGRI